MTKSFTPSLSRSAIRLPVCCVDSPGTGRSPFLLVACCHLTSVAFDKGPVSDKSRKNAASGADGDDPVFMARVCQKLAEKAFSQFRILLKGQKPNPTERPCISGMWVGGYGLVERRGIRRMNNRVTRYTRWVPRRSITSAW